MGDRSRWLLWCSVRAAVLWFSLASGTGIAASVKGPPIIVFNNVPSSQISDWFDVRPYCHAVMDVIHSSPTVFTVSIEGTSLVDQNTAGEIPWVFKDGAGPFRFAPQRGAPSGTYWSSQTIPLNHAMVRFVITTAPGPSGGYLSLLLTPIPCP